MTLLAILLIFPPIPIYLIWLYGNQKRIALQFIALAMIMGGCIIGFLDDVGKNGLVSIGVITCVILGVMACVMIYFTYKEWKTSPYTNQLIKTN